MRCLHPHCPMGEGAANWEEVVDHYAMKTKRAERAALLAALAPFGPLNDPVAPLPKPKMTGPQFKMLTFLCPCLFNQVNAKVSARAVVHFCEVKLGTRIVATNVYDAFKVQHPKMAPPFAFGPAVGGASGGDIMEMLCSEVLSNSGIPVMWQDEEEGGWPKWQMPGHILLNEGQMRALRAFGDILIPCGPTNLVISVKSEAAKERLLYSSNSIEGVGFGFFKHAKEFWSESRMNLYKRMGFSAIYMPDVTYSTLMEKLEKTKRLLHAVNVNGTPLYRPHSEFASDMKRVVGRSSMLL